MRASGLTSLAYLSDWSYLAADPAMRISDGPLALSVVVHRHLDAREGRERHRHAVCDQPVQSGRQVPRAEQFKPTDVGVAAYVDDTASQRDCTLPLANIAGYQGLGTGVSDADTATHIQIQSTVTRVRTRTRCGPASTSGMRRNRTGGGNRSGQFTFDRTYTRQASDESQLTPSNLGLSLAAFELGLPTSASIARNAAASYGNYYFGAFGQDSGG